MNRFKHPSAPNTSPERKPEQSRSISLKKAFAIGAVPLLLLFGAAFQSSNSVPAQLNAIQAQNTALGSQITALQAQVASLVNNGPREFYLTTTTHPVNEVLSACAEGYHTAAMYEIHDPTDLRYETVLGLTLPDSGSGPPTNQAGWIRTGFSGIVSAIPGQASCQTWSTTAGQGTLVSLNSQWFDDATSIDPWNAGGASCALEFRVWCVQD